MNQEFQQQKVIQTFTDFLTTSLDIQLRQHLSTKASDRVVELFYHVAGTVPAYRDFLKAHHINIQSIKGFADFQQLPPITKQNYLQQYPLSSLCRYGQLEKCDMVAVSSGSTGKPTFWPRFLTDELQIATRFEQIFYDSFATDTRRTLAVVCFTLGTWVGGMYTANCCRYLAYLWWWS